MNYKELEQWLKRQLAETVASNDTVVELPAPVDYRTWQAKYRRHIRCMIWWDELEHPRPKVGRQIFIAKYPPYGLYYPWFEDPGEWRTRKPNPPVSVNMDKFHGERLILVPGLFVPDKGFLILDGAHRVRDLEPRLIVMDWIQVTKNQLCSIADTIGTFWQNENGRRRNGTHRKID